MSSGLDSDFFFYDLDLTRTRTLETRAWTRTQGIVTRLQHWLAVRTANEDANANASQPTIDKALKAMLLRL